MLLGATLDLGMLLGATLDLGMLLGATLDFGILLGVIGVLDVVITPLKQGVDATDSPGFTVALVMH